MSKSACEGAAVAFGGARRRDPGRVSEGRFVAVSAVLLAVLGLPMPAIGQTAAAGGVAQGTGAEVAPPVALVVGKSTLVRLPEAIERISIGNPAVLDVTLTGTRELYMLGKTFGSSNVMMWRSGGAVTVVDVTVSIDTSGLQQQLASILPSEREIVVRSAADSIVLSGSVSSALKADHAVQVAEGYSRAYARTAVAAGQGLGAGPGSAGAATPGFGGGSSQSPKVINLLAIAQPQQVMLEVKVAEVARSLIDQFGISLGAAITTAGAGTVGIVTSQLLDVFGSLGLIKSGTGGRITQGSRLSVDGKNEDGAVKVLAEPNIVAISGQEASFLAGGKIFIPVARSNDNGGTTVTLEEKEFGVGLKFTPVVLDGDLISLRVAPEVSELSRTGTPFVTTGGVTTVLPAFTTRKAQTTVQLRDGQSLAIAGLIKNNVTENIKRFPFLGDIPILGALFRSTEFQTDRSELLFVITPRLVKALAAPVALPTDNFRPASRAERILEGKIEAAPAAEAPAAGASSPDGLKIK